MMPKRELQSRYLGSPHTTGKRQRNTQSRYIPLLPLLSYAINGLERVFALPDIGSVIGVLEIDLIVSHVELEDLKQRVAW